MRGILKSKLVQRVEQGQSCNLLSNVGQECGRFGSKSGGREVAFLVHRKEASEKHTQEVTDLKRQRGLSVGGTNGGMGNVLDEINEKSRRSGLYDCPFLKNKDPADAAPGSLQKERCTRAGLRKGSTLSQRLKRARKREETVLLNTQIRRIVQGQQGRRQCGHMFPLSVRADETSKKLIYRPDM